MRRWRESRRLLTRLMASRTASSTNSSSARRLRSGTASKSKVRRRRIHRRRAGAASFSDPRSCVALYYCVAFSRFCTHKRRKIQSRCRAGLHVLRLAEEDGEGRATKRARVVKREPVPPALFVKHVPARRERAHEVPLSPRLEAERAGTLAHALETLARDALGSERRELTRRRGRRSPAPAAIGRRRRLEHALHLLLRRARQTPHRRRHLPHHRFGVALLACSGGSEDALHLFARALECARVELRRRRRSFAQPRRRELALERHRRGSGALILLLLTRLRLLLDCSRKERLSLLCRRPQSAIARKGVGSSAIHTRAGGPHRWRVVPRPQHSQ
mmetsp:Transcript_30437/g.98924  ORF Transcript_30437/g.98924 Transcript_30437/m.98924 type:complete len:332 (-) Transcript_30437:154-1149(-)